jgi:predicted cobalt transporter CbtA
LDRELLGLRPDAGWKRFEVIVNCSLVVKIGVAAIVAACGKE